MSFEALFPELMRSTGSVDANAILRDLLDDKNIDTKTHILTPVEMAILDAYVDYITDMIVFCKTKGLRRTAKFLSKFLIQFKKYMVSWKRLSRTEVTNTLSAIQQRETGTSFVSKLLGMGGKDRNGQ